MSFIFRLSVLRFTRKYKTRMGVSLQKEKSYLFDRYVLYQCPLVVKVCL
jgi:hypothetical protein